MTRVRHRYFARILGATPLLACAGAHRGLAGFHRSSPHRAAATAMRMPARKKPRCAARVTARRASRRRRCFRISPDSDAEYLYWQLVEFKREARPESPMTSQVANLDDAVDARPCGYFASLPPGHSGAAPLTRDRRARRRAVSQRRSRHAARRRARAATASTAAAIRWPQDDAELSHLSDAARPARRLCRRSASRTSATASTFRRAAIGS